MGQHTPGPWDSGHFVDDSISCNCRSITAEAYMGGICTIEVDNGKRVGDGGNDCPPLEEAKANKEGDPILSAWLPDAHAAIAAHEQQQRGVKLKPEQVIYVRSMGKALRVTAIFPDDASANKYLANHRDEGVIAEFGNLVFIANIYDRGAAIAKATTA